MHILYHSKGFIILWKKKLFVCALKSRSPSRSSSEVNLLDLRAKQSTRLCVLELPISHCKCAVLHQFLSIVWLSCNFHISLTFFILTPINIFIENLVSRVKLLSSPIYMQICDITFLFYLSHKPKRSCIYVCHDDRNRINYQKLT